MEENVALDSTKKKKFLKSIKGIKKLIQKNEKKEEPEKSIVEEKTEQKKSKKKPRPERGLVYLSHIPHGFYEHQMTEYFKQFGGVTNVRVIRSKRTGRSKGFAFVEFHEPSVAQIVAETMNNYLMGKRLIKAAYVPPEKQRKFAMRKFWSEVHNPGAIDRIKHKKAFNAVKDENQEMKQAKKQLANLEKTKKKLREIGINYDFFMPVDVPLDLIKVKEEKDDESIEVKEKTKVEPPKQKKGNIEKVDSAKKVTKETKVVKKPEPVKSNKEQKVEPDVKKGKKAKKETGQIVQIMKIDKKEQEQKQKKLDKAGVKNVQNFIKMPESDNDSDSSAEFDSDEYEKMIEDEDDDLSSNESDGSGDDNEDDEEDDDDDDDVNDDSASEESVVDFPPPKPKTKAVKPIPPKNVKQQKQQQPVNKPEQVKRKAPQKAPVTPKKPKFEKQNKPVPVKKQFKKKK